MAIKRIKVSNFKSFNKLDIELGKFEVVIGANASGKSNFTHIFEFIKDIVNYGLENAISMHGGIEYLTNINITHNNELSIAFVSDHKVALSRGQNGGKITVEIIETMYEFSLQPNNNKSEYKITKDRYSFLFNILRNNEITEDNIGNGTIIIYADKSKIIIEKFEINYKDPNDKPINIDDLVDPFIEDEILPLKTLLIENSYYFRFLPSFEDIISEISIYDFYPKTPKMAMPITGKAQLEKDGNNLLVVMRHIEKSIDKKRKFQNLLNNLLPFVVDLSEKKYSDKMSNLQFREIYSEKYLPSSVLSDGTINIVALIIALFFEEKPLTIIEEPERNLHPSILSKVAEMVKDASTNKQIIVTTHNPEMIKHVGLENILLVSRDENGFSQVSRPSEKQEIKTFLENDLGIDELYVQNLLEI